MMRRCWTLLAVFGFILPVFAARPAHAENTLTERLERFLRRPDYANSRWGILAIDKNSGKTVCQLNADQPFMPASTIKLYFAAAALAELGANSRFETPVYARGEESNGRLQGDLILVAQGDLTLGGRDDGKGHMAYTDDDHTYANGATAHSILTNTDPLAGLKALAHQIHERGISRIDGDVLIDDRLFDKARGSGTGPELLTPIVVNDNLVDVIITPGSGRGEPARVMPWPATNLLRIDSRIVTVALDQPTRIFVKVVGPNAFLVHGQIAEKSARVVRGCAMPDPTLFAREQFIETLRGEGIVVRADSFRPSRAELPSWSDYAKLRRVALFQSLPFSELLKVTLKVSSNLYANTFPLLIAVKHGKRTLPEGLKLQEHALADLGVDLNGVNLTTASGFSDTDSVTPRSIVRLLQVLSRRPDYDVLEAGLPVLGKDGTLADTVPASSAVHGKVHAKTGTYYLPETRMQAPLLRCKSLVGILSRPNNQVYFFAFFVNDVRLPRGETPDREGRVLGQMCEILYEQGP